MTPLKTTGAAPEPTESKSCSPSHASPLSLLAVALLAASGLIVLIFGSYELIERAWFSHLDPEARRLLYSVRGIFTSLVVAIMVGWIILRSSPALLTATDARTGTPDFSERERLYTQWFIAMRWVAVVVATLMVFLSVRIFHLLPSEVWRPLLLTIAALAGLNILYTYFLAKLQTSRGMLAIQGYGDLVLLTVLLHFSGGIENPLAILMIFHVVIGGILISQKECYRMATTGSILFALLAIATISGILSHHPIELYPHVKYEINHSAHLPFFVGTAIALHTAILFLTAYFVTTLAERIRQNEMHLIAMAESALAEHHLLEQALETTSTGLRVLSPKLAQCWANDHWKQWFGPGHCDGCPTPKEPHCITAAESLRTGEVIVTEIVRPLDETSGAQQDHDIPHERILQITSAPIRDGHGFVTRVAQLAQDVTPQKQAHTRMMRAGQMAAVGELAGQVAHEVNNPIAIISAKATLLLSDHRDGMSTKVARELEKITDLSNRVARIAQGLLSYCRPSPSSHRPLDIRLPIRKSLAMIEQRSSSNNICMIDTLPDQPVMITGNVGELEQVFINLFLNAIHAMPTGGQLTVSARTTFPDTHPDEKPNIAVTIDDSGNGVPAELREQIFEPFFTTRADAHGTGLGLSICQGLIRSHDGEVTIEEAPGGGARFTVSLPLLSAATSRESTQPQTVA